MVKSCGKQPSGNEGQNDAKKSDDGSRIPDSNEFGGLYFKADTEEQKHYSEFSERYDQCIRFDPPQHMWTKQNTCEDFSHDAWLPEMLEELGKQLRRSENHEHRERQLCRIGGYECHGYSFLVAIIFAVLLLCASDAAIDTPRARTITPSDTGVGT